MEANRKQAYTLRGVKIGSLLTCIMKVRDEKGQISNRAAARKRMANLSGKKNRLS
ncbi:uncharacterized protein METZ01_LOCUS473234, partial [marine metagenome]